MNKSNIKNILNVSQGLDILEKIADIVIRFQRSQGLKSRNSFSMSQKAQFPQRDLDLPQWEDRTSISPEGLWKDFIAVERWSRTRHSCTVFTEQKESRVSTLFISRAFRLNGSTRTIISA